METGPPQTHVEAGAPGSRPFRCCPRVRESFDSAPGSVSFDGAPGSRPFRWCPRVRVSFDSAPGSRPFRCPGFASVSVPQVRVSFDAPGSRQFRWCPRFASVLRMLTWAPTPTMERRASRPSSRAGARHQAPRPPLPPRTPESQDSRTSPSPSRPATPETSPALQCGVRHVLHSPSPFRDATPPLTYTPRSVDPPRTPKARHGLAFRHDRTRKKASQRSNPNGPQGTEASGSCTASQSGQTIHAKRPRIGSGAASCHPGPPYQAPVEAGALAPGTPARALLACWGVACLAEPRSAGNLSTPSPPRTPESQDSQTSSQPQSRRDARN